LSLISYSFDCYCAFILSFGYNAIILPLEESFRGPKECVSALIFRFIPITFPVSPLLLQNCLCCYCIFLLGIVLVHLGLIIMANRISHYSNCLLSRDSSRSKNKALKMMQSLLDSLEGHRSIG